MAISSAACAGRAVGLLDSLDDYGQIGEKIEDSVFVRAYCCLCGEAIRVPLYKAEFPNVCDKRSHRGSPAIALAEQNFYFEQFQLDAADKVENEM